MPAFAVYARKSIFSGRGDSIESQIKICSGYIRTHFVDVSGSDIRIFEDEGFSGRNTARPGFQRMLEHVRSGQVRYVVCYRLDRISRSVHDFSGLIELLRQHHTHFICVKEAFDTAAPMGRAMMYIASVFAELERETIGERVKDNLTLLARTGRWLGGPRPIGFRPAEEWIHEGGKKRTAYRLEPIPEEISAVRRIYSVFLNTRSLNGTVRKLHQEGVASRKGNPLSIPSLKTVLRNPVYAKATVETYRYFEEKGSDLAFSLHECDGVHGLMTYNRTTEDQNQKRPRGRSEWILSVGAHTGVIEGADWVRVQEDLDLKAMRYAGKSRRRHTALLAGITCCRICGSPMRVQMDQKPKKDGNRPMRYVCAQKKTAGKTDCGVPNADAYVADHLLWAELVERHAENMDLRGGLDQIKRSIRQELQKSSGTGGPLAERLAQVKSATASLIHSLARGGVPPRLIEQIKDQIHALETERKEIEAKLRAGTNDSEHMRTANERSEMIGALYLRLKSPAVTEAADDRRALIRALVERIEWDGENLHVFLSDQRQD